MTEHDQLAIVRHLVNVVIDVLLSIPPHDAHSPRIVGANEPYHSIVAVAHDDERSVNVRHVDKVD